MASVSYSITAGGNLETVTAGTSAPGAGSIELRIDQGTTVVTDNGSTRALKRGEIAVLLDLLQQYLLKDTNISQ